MNAIFHLFGLRIAEATALTTSTIATTVTDAKASVLDVAGDNLPVIIAGVVLILLVFWAWRKFKKLFGLRA